LPDGKVGRQTLAGAHVAAGRRGAPRASGCRRGGFRSSLCKPRRVNSRQSTVRGAGWQDCGERRRNRTEGTHGRSGTGSEQRRRRPLGFLAPMREKPLSYNTSRRPAFARTGCPKTTRSLFRDAGRYPGFELASTKRTSMIKHHTVAKLLRRGERFTRVCESEARALDEGGRRERCASARCVHLVSKTRRWLRVPRNRHPPPPSKGGDARPQRLHGVVRAPEVRALLGDEAEAPSYSNATPS